MPMRPSSVLCIIIITTYSIKGHPACYRWFHLCSGAAVMCKCDLAQACIYLAAGPLILLISTHAYDPDRMV